MKSTKLTILAGVIATALIFAAPSAAFSATSPTAKVVTVLPTGFGNQHTVVFQVCAGSDTPMRAPAVLVRSASEIKTVHLNMAIAKDTCKTTATQINAFDGSKIKINVVDKSLQNKMIDKAEKRLAQVKADIEATNDELQAFLQIYSGNIEAKKSDKIKLAEFSSKLVELRKELKDARSDYYNWMHLIMVK